MKIATTRFGTLDAAEADLIELPFGLTGFPDDLRFVLLRSADDSPVGWLQSLDSAWLALPVVAVCDLDLEIDARVIAEAAHRATVATDEDCAVMVVVSARPGTVATVNLMAPIVVDVATRVGAQVLLADLELPADAPFVLREPSAPPAAERTGDAAAAP